MRVAALSHSLAVALLAVAPLVASAEDDPYARPGFYVGLAGVYPTQQSLFNSIEAQVSGSIEIFNKEVEDWNVANIPDQENWSGPELRHSTKVDEGWGINARVGYRFGRFFSAEAQVEYVKGYETRVELTNIWEVRPPGEGGDFIDEQIAELRNRHAFVTATANGKFTLPTGRFQPFALFGMGMFHNHTSNGLAIAYTEGQPKATLEEDYGDRSGTAFAIRAGGGVDIYITHELAINFEGTYVQPITRADRLDYLSFGVGLQYHF